MAIDPSLYQAHTCLGNALAAQGKFAEATAQYDRALALRPDFVDAHYNRADVRKFHRGDGELAALEQLAANLGRFLPLERTRIHFALGKALEDVGDYDRAFQQLLAGNALQRQAIDYDPAREEQAFQLIAQAFDAGLFERLRGWRSFDRADLHRRHAPLRHLARRANSGQPSGGPRRRRAVDHAPRGHRCHRSAGPADSLPAVCRRGGCRIFWPAGPEAIWPACPGPRPAKTRVTDKTPGNFTYAGLIRLMLPPRGSFTPPATRSTRVCPVSRSYSSSARHSATIWPSWAAITARYSKLMDHWRAVLPAGTMLDVRYEDVVDNLEEQARRLLEFCGLPWDERCLDFHQTDRPVNTASGLQVRRPIYRTSLQRWRRYEAHLGPLFSALGLPEPGPAAAAGQDHVR